jgi:cellobiose phosphorylase
MAPVIASSRGARDTARALPSSELEPLDGLQAWNGLGGFAEDGREYVIELKAGQATPAPWSNVVANEQAGFIVSERGSGYTWAVNSRENRLTPWSNDPASDPSGEALYLRDEESGALWAPLPQPIESGSFRVRHGFGYSVFEHRQGTIESWLTLGVAPEDPVKIFQLRLRNDGDQRARLTATLYVEWVLGVLREQMAPYVITELDQASGALLARNPYNYEFGERVAFMAASEAASWVTGDRGEFIGRNGLLSHPEALAHGSAPAGTGSLGAGFDPCGVWQTLIELEPGAERTLIFVLGQGADRTEAQRLVGAFCSVKAAAQALEATRAYWRNLVSAIQVRTPQPEIDLLLNGWLLYQTLACRVLGRSAFYQSGGAYGYRDQLQDVMALTHATPEITRAQIVLHASRQFVEGDVQHWWHPPSGRGIRTSFSDDYLWLPFVTLHYVEATGDLSVLDEQATFLEGRPLKPGEDEYYDLPEVSQERGSVYEHCLRAIEYGIGRTGQHGLPLMGSGDWNDGMNKVGNEGRGESVWVGWFQLVILPQFAELAEARGDAQRAARYRAEAARLRRALEMHAWDGEWYLRAFYDDGTPLGSAHSEECRIDSLSQSWAVIAGADEQRAAQGMRAVDTMLVDRQAGLIRLFTPAFDQSSHDPGYIKGYVPGVRENGGQYTHAAIWVVWAFAQIGDGQRAVELMQLINPVRHGTHELDRYRVEPYVVAADVYTAAGHLGRGGWTWYTGSAGWLYRLGVEMVLGVRRVGDELEIAPCIAPEWPGFEVNYRFGSASYQIVVERAQRDEQPGITLDGEHVDGRRVPLHDDGQAHELRVRLRQGAATLDVPQPADEAETQPVDEAP